MRWPRASHHPHKTNQMTLAIADPAPASALLTTVLPNGHSAKIPMRRDAIPKGIVMIRMKQMSAAIAYAIAIHSPAGTNQMMFSSNRTASSPS